MIREAKGTTFYLAVIPGQMPIYFSEAPGSEVSKQSVDLARLATDSSFEIYRRIEFTEGATGELIVDAITRNADGGKS